jgi:O-antigen/teichoic acid export membrane protein
VKPLPPKNTATRFASKGALLFLVKLLPATAVLAVMWLYAHRIDLVTFGHYQNFWIRYSLLSTFTSLGLPTYVLLLSRDDALALPRYLRKQPVALFLLWCALAGGVFAWWEHPIVPVWLPISFLMVWTLGLLLESGLVAARAYKLVLLVNVVYSVLFLAIHTAVLHQKPLLTAVFEWLLGLGLLKIISYGLFWGRLLRRNPVRMDVQLPGISTWFHIGANDIIQQSFKVVDKFLVSFLSTPALSAIYFVGAQELPFLSLLLGTVSAVFMQQVAEKQHRTEGQMTYWIRYTSEILAAVVFPLFCFLMLCRYELVDWLFTPKFRASVEILVIANFCILFRIYPFTAILLQLKGGKWVSGGSVGHLVLAAVLAVPLYHLLGLKGIMWAILIADLSLGVFYIRKMQQLSGMRITQLLPLHIWARQAICSGILLYGLYEILLLSPVTAVQRLLLHSIGMGLVGFALLGIALRRARRTAV